MKRRLGHRHIQRKDRVRTQGGDSHLHTKERGLRGSRPADPDLGLPASRALGTCILVKASRSVGILLQQPELVHQVYKLTSPSPLPEPPSSLPVPPLVPPTTPSLSAIALENFLKCRSHSVTPNSDSATQNKLQIPNSGPLRLLRPVYPLTHLLFCRQQAPASRILHLTLLLPRAPSSALHTHLRRGVPPLYCK